MNNTNRKTHFCPCCKKEWTHEEQFAQACLECGYPENDCEDSEQIVWEEE